MYEQFGDRFSTSEEVRMVNDEVSLKDNSFGIAGLPLMSDTENVVIDNSDSHSLIIGGSGSGKNRRLLFLLVYLIANAGENAVICDPKGETYARTAEYCRAKGYKVRVLDFRHPGKRGDFWNPMSLILKHKQEGKTDEMQEDIADIANILAAPQRRTTNDVFWVEMATPLLIGLNHILIDSADIAEVNIGSLARMCSLDSISIIEQLAEKIPRDSLAGINISGTVSSPEKTKQCIYATLFAMVSPFMNQQGLIDALSQSTFDLDELANEKSMLYIITPDEKESMNIVVSLLIKQINTVLIGAAQKRDDLKLERRVHMLLDEFANIPKVPGFTSMISASRSRNIKMYIVIQSLHQLMSKYSEDDAQVIIGNCANIAYLHSRELPLLRMLSDLCGTRYMSDGRQFPVISPSQLQYLKKGEILFFCGNGRLRPFVTQMPDIDEYEIFRQHEMSVTPASVASPAKIFSAKKLLEDIERGIKPIPFTEPKEEESYVERYEKEHSSDDGYKTLEDALKQKFDELFGDDT